MMLINMGNAPVLMHLSLSFFLQYKVSCQKKGKRIEKKKWLLLQTFGVLVCLLVHLHLEVETIVHNFGNKTIAVSIFSYLCKD